MNPSDPQIVSSFDIGSLTVRNRLAVAPMTRVSATQTGSATHTMARYYERFAKGGFGLVITEGMYTDRAFAQGYPFQPGITDQAQALAWKDVNEAIHLHASKVFAQLMHAGAISQGNRFVADCVGPSVVRPKGEQMKFYHGEGAYRVPLAMSDEQIADAIQGFAHAAELAIGTAGFDGIEIHGANGYLLDQFLTDYTNLRSDRWGGDVRQRMGVILEVIGAVNKVAGQAPVGIRISQGKVNDFEHKWSAGPADADVIFGELADAGVDFIHVTEFEAWQPAFPHGTESLVTLARRFAPNTPLIANGGVQSVHRAQQVLDHGADLIALGKAALANPDFPRLLANGQPAKDFDPTLLGPIANIKARELEA